VRRGFAIFLAAAFVSTLVVAYSQEIKQSEAGGSTQPVPFLEGQELAAAQREVGDDFDLMSSEEYSSQPKGTVLSQSPKPGVEAQRGEKISIVVSAGPVMVEVPNVMGKPAEEAINTLSADGLEVKVRTEERSEEEDDKVVEQSPSGGEVEKGSEVEITLGQAPKPAPGYNEIQDPTGSLTVEVPPDWGIETGTDSEKEAGQSTWSHYAGEDITSSITVARSLEAWYQGQGAEGGSGAYVVASRTLAQYTDDQLIHSLLFKDKAQKCSPGPYEDFDRPPYSGKMQTWYHCSDKDNTFFIVAAAPQDRECVVVLAAKFAPGAGEADRKAVLHFRDTFEVDCGRVA
jgi:hypothetical protein